MAQTTEIERKFLVLSPPDNMDRWPHSTLRQGYLAVSDEAEVRLRARGEQRTETVKSTGDMVREEREIELSVQQFDSLWPATAGRRIEKTRYEIEAGDVVVELDVYHKSLKGLMTAEVEFTTAGEANAFVPPDWFGAEVTSDPRYKNRCLAIRGLPEIT